MEYNRNYKIKQICVYVMVFVMSLQIFNVNIVYGADTGLNETKIKGTTFGLTEEEYIYINKLRGNKIRFGITDESEYRINNDGKEAGTAVPIINFLKYELDLGVEVISGEWNDIYNKAVNGEIDFINNLYINDKTAKEFYLGTPIYNSSISAIINKDNTKGDNVDQSSLTVGMIKNSASEYYAVPYLHSYKQIKYYNGKEALINAINDGDINIAVIPDVYMSTLFDDYNLHVSYTFPQVHINNTIGTRNEEYKKVLEIFNRFMDWTDEGDILRNQIEGEEERFNIEIFYEKEKDIIDKITDKYKAIKYYPGSSENLPVSYKEGDSVKGIVKELFDYFEDLTGINFEAVENIEEPGEVIEMLNLNKIQFAADIVKNKINKEEFGYSDSIYENRFIVITGIGNSKITNENVNDYYWGILAENEALFENSIFDGRMVTFSSDRELLKAVENKEIDGAIVKQGLFDYYNMALNEKRYKRVTDIYLPYMEQIAYNKKNADINELMKKLLHMYKIFHPGYEEKWKDTTINYQNAMAEYYLKEAEIRNKLFLTGTCIAFLTVAAAVFIVISTRKIRKLNMKLKVLVNSNKKVDIIEINLNRGHIRSSSNFTMFGVSGMYGKRDSHGRFYSLDELSKRTGYDFIKHYKDIKQRGTNVFEEEYVIGIKGRNICIREIGNISKQYIVSTLFDITDKEEEKGILKHKAEYDCLTGIYNRTAYVRKIADIIEEYPDKLGAFAFIDLNKFKSINDEYGHKAGDDLLVSFAESLEGLVKNEETVVFRIAGDEFGAFRGNLKSDMEIKKFVGELSSLSMEAVVDNKKVTGTYSCGVSVYNRDGIDIMTLSECSDIAMYMSKKKGTVVELYDKKMRQS